jgi:membrane-associated phospholipid phosphatase
MLMRDMDESVAHSDPRWLVPMATQVIRSSTQSPRPNGRWKQYATTFNSVMALALVTLIPVEIALAKVVHLSGLAQILDTWPGFVILIACLCYCRWRPLPKLIDSTELAIWAALLTGVLSLLIQIAGRSARPLKDHALTAMDRRLHFSTALFVHLVRSLPALELIISITYALLPLLIITALMVPPFWGHVNASRRYTLGILLSAIFTAVLFAFWPAAGPWTIQSLTPTKEQAAVTAYLTLLNSHTPVTLDMNNAGIVSFPSFHVVLAILSAIALSSVRSLRAPAWIFAVLICISTILTGWHYGIDVLSGLIVAIVSISVASRILRP